MNLFNLFENIRSGCLFEVLYNIFFLRINVLVFVMYIEDENCCINNSYYFVVYIVAVILLGKGKKRIVIFDYDKKLDVDFFISYVFYFIMR